MSDPSKSLSRPTQEDEPEPDPEFCECWYGAFAGGDPRTFRPDSLESGTTQKELDSWVNDCKIADEWSRYQIAWGPQVEHPGEEPAHVWLQLPNGHVAHFSRQKYGLGLNLCPLHTPQSSREDREDP